LIIPSRQKHQIAMSAYQSAGFTSAYLAFRRSVPAFQQENRKYLFLDSSESLHRILLSPFGFSYLKRPTTWIPLAAATGLAATLSYLDRKQEAGHFYSYEVHDAFYTSGISYGAGVSEEALFRGYIYPFAHERLGNWFVSDVVQSMLFGLAHYGEKNGFPILQTALGFYFGYLTHRNSWTIGESIFIHFWYDAIVFTAGFLSQREEANLAIHLEIPLIAGR